MKPKPGNSVRFMEEVLAVAGPLGWQPRPFRREAELVAVAPLEGDASFAQVLWSFDTLHHSMRCLLAGRATVPAERETAVVELCARINDGLVFGCAGFDFDERVVVFRESCEFTDDSPPGTVERATARLLQLGTRYAPAVAAVLAGTLPAAAVASVESSGEE